MKRYYLPDFECGFLIEVSKDVYECYIRMWDVICPSLASKTEKPLLYGTERDLDELFYEHR